MTFLMTEEGIKSLVDMFDYERWLFDAAIMKSYGAKPVVPAMAMVVYAANLTGNFLPSARSIEFYFAHLIPSNHELNVQVDNTDPLERIISATDGEREYLTLDGKQSKISINPIQMPTLTDYVEDSLPHDPAKVAAFGKVIQSANDDITRLLYAIAASSWAIGRAVKDPVYREEGIIGKFENSKKYSAIHQSILVSLPEGITRIDPDSGLSYKVKAELNKKSVQFNVECSQNGILVYSLKSNLEVMSRQEAVDRLPSLK